MKNPFFRALGRIIGRAAASAALVLSGVSPCSQGQSFDPANYGNVTLHLRADALSQADLSAVTAWGNLSAAGEGERPTYLAADVRFNGKPVVRFDGFDDLLRWESAACRARTIFAVVSLEAEAPELSGLFSNSHDRLNVRRNDGTRYYRSAGHHVDSNDFTGNAPAGTFYVNNTQDGPYTAGAAHLVMAVAGGQKTYDSLWMGSPQAALGRFFNGSVAEVIIYDGLLTQEGIDRVGWYLQDKYGLPTDFPAPEATVQFTATAGNSTVSSHTGVLSPAGAAVTLAWDVKDATSVSIDRGVLAATPEGTGLAIVSPAITTTYTLTARNGTVSASQSLTVYIGVDPEAARLNEFLASNSGGLRDEDGDSSDWIEIFNPNPFLVDLQGYRLRDSASNWVFPAGSMIEGNGYRVVFASSKNRNDPAANLHTNFGLSAAGEPLALLKPDGSVATTIDPGFPAQQANISGGLEGANSVFFPLPTPGAANGPSVPGLVGDVQFSVGRGFYSAPFQLSLSTATVGASIRYTLDSSTPTETNGLVYGGPLAIGKTTLIRARAFFPGFLPTSTVTASYLFQADILTGQTYSGSPPAGWPAGPVNGQVLKYGWNASLKAQYTTTQLLAGLNQIPSLSIITDQANLTDPAYGIYVNASEKGDEWEQPASVEYLVPDNSPGFSVNAGLKIRGGYSRNDQFAKHSLRLQFRSRYGDSSLQFPLHGSSGADEFETLDLRTEQNYHWANETGTQNTAVREVFCRDLMAALGEPTTRSRYFHLYLNGQYWGLYQTEERAQEDYGASYFGGRADDYDVVQTSNHPDFTYELAHGTIDAWQTLWTKARAHQANPTAANYFSLLGRDANGQRNPALPVSLDVDNLITYMLLHYYTGDGDAPLSNFLGMNRANNWRGMRSRGSNDGFRFFVHDSEHTLMAPNWVENRATTNAPNGSNRGNFTYGNPEWIHEDLSANPEYRIRFADFAQKFLFNGGPMTPAAAQAIFDSRAAQISQAIVPDLARWGTSTTSHTLSQWQSRLAAIRSGFFPSRPASLLTQLRTRGFFPSVNAPTFSLRGGKVDAGYRLTLNAGTQTGTIYYTLDGSDPRAIGGGISGTAYSAPGIAINNLITVRTRFRSNGGVWSALDEASFSALSPAVAGKLVVSKVHYHPTDASSAETAAGYTGSSDFEYVELQNISGETLSLEGLSLTTAVTFNFANPAIQTLAPGGRVVVAGNASAFAFRYGGGLPVAGSYSGSLNNSGETLRLQDADGSTIVEFTYDDLAPWPASADGEGPALVLIHPAGNPDPALAEHWAASFAAGGKPGGEDLLDLAELRGLYFSAADLADPTKESSLWGDAADPDQDGVGNLAELAMGSSPVDALSHSTARFSWWKDPVSALQYLTLDCPLREGVAGISVKAEASGNLVDWPEVIPVVGIPVSRGNGISLAVFRDTVPLGAGSRFMRLRISRQ